MSGKRNGNVTVGRREAVRPRYFDRVADNARRRWDQLEADPELAGPWQQLFKQVQSPRHVLSELLQNADDAGAKWASARIEGDTFVFEHDGDDFDESNFSSLCRFGFSNKRNLHTIGFRGVGFKSTFSLGGTVHLATPTLAVRFEKRRFTEPVWDMDAPTTEVTTVRVRMQDAIRRKELQKNLQEWTGSPASLLFFRKICELEIGGHKITRRVLRKGPVPRSEWIELASAETYEVLRLRSQEEAFPAEVVEEIRQERIAEDISLPPCSVEIVLGLPDDQRLYVVLPTGVRPDLPFSCNAPFLQDPARMGLKDPTISPTNQWLLRRLGELGAHAMLGWIGNADLSMEDRAEGYDLLPSPPQEAGDVDDDCAGQISRAFGEACEGAPALLTDDGLLVQSKSCVAPPPEVYDVWSARQIVEVFGDPEESVLCRHVSDVNRDYLSDWGWATSVTAAQVIERLRTGERPPKPREWDSLLRLWAFVQAHIGWDYGATKRKTLRIAPVKGHGDLYAPAEVVRLSTAKSVMSPEDWDFLSEYMLVLDRNWLNRLSEMQKRKNQHENDGRNQEVEAAFQLLADVGLDTPSQPDTLIAQAAASLCDGDEVLVSNLVRLTHVAAAMDAEVPSTFKYVARSCSLNEASSGMVATLDGRVEALLPETWIEEHLLHEDYTSSFRCCTKQQWREWSRSAKSGLHSFAIIRQKTDYRWSKPLLEDFLRERQAHVPGRYPYKRENFTILDYDFDDELIEHWTKSAGEDPSLWTRVVRMMLDNPLNWTGKHLATIRQSGTSYSEPVHCGDIPAAWVDRFRKLKCLPDTHGCAAEPAELLMRSPETDPLMGVERFVLADYDTPATKTLLKLLGVRDTPAGTEKLVQRIRDLSQVGEVPIHEVAKWYDAIDRVLVRCRPDDLARVTEAFRDEQLIVTSEGEWATSHEVFRLKDDDALPGAPVIHDSVANLSMWGRVGVADRPSPALVIQWLEELESGQTLEGADLRRVRSYLQQFPDRVWTECGHWLTLDGTWAETGDFRFYVWRRPDSRVNALFPKFKAAVADLSMLPRESEHPALAETSDLNAVIEYRLSDRSLPDPSEGEQRPWLLALGQCLARTVLPEEHLERVRDCGRRLSRSVLHHQPGLSVIPYIEEAPAGEQVSVKALWSGVALLIAEDSPARYTEPLIDELSRAFAHPRVSDAVRVCIDRTQAYVEAYFEENFELGPFACDDASARAETVGTTSDASNHNGDAPEVPGDPGAVAVDSGGADDERLGLPRSEPEHGGAEWESLGGGNGQHASAADSDEDDPRAAGDPGVEGEDQPTHHHSYVNSRSDSIPRVASPTRDVRSSPVSREPGGPTFVTQFARSRGFEWNPSGGAYVRRDGHSISPAPGPFQWVWKDARHNAVRRLWVAEQSMTKGVEMDTQVWEAIKSGSRSCSVVLLSDDGRPAAVAGETLVRMVEEKQVVIYPATFRLRKSED